MSLLQGDRAGGWSNELGRHRSPSAGGNPPMKVDLPNCLCSTLGQRSPTADATDAAAP